MKKNWRSFVSRPCSLVKGRFERSARGKHRGNPLHVALIGWISHARRAAAAAARAGLAVRFALPLPDLGSPQQASPQVDNGTCPLDLATAAAATVKPRTTHGSRIWTACGTSEVELALSLASHRLHQPQLELARLPLRRPELPSGLLRGSRTGSAYEAPGPAPMPSLDPRGRQRL